MYRGYSGPSLSFKSPPAGVLLRGRELHDSRIDTGPSSRAAAVARVPERTYELPGRAAEQAQLHDYIRGNRPVQVVGEARMGGSSTLQWLHLTLKQEGRSSVLLDATSFETPSALELVRALASALDREVEVRARLEAPGDFTRRMQEALSLLTPCVVLIDHADVLDPQQFPKEFFQAWKQLSERGTVRGKLIWVSSSRQCLFQGWKSLGHHVTFLNEAAKVWLGPIDPLVARGLLDGCGQAGRERGRGLPNSTLQQALDTCGCFADGLLWLGERLYLCPERLDELLDEYRETFRPVFAQWWQNREPGEQVLLRRCVRERVDARGLRAHERRVERQVARRLESLGLLTEQNGYYVLQGQAWREYVETCTSL
ncbi:MAG: AAA family ATPase [Myxococcota bacterium]